MSYPLSFPDLKISSHTLRLRRAQARDFSPYTFAGQTISHPGTAWEYEIKVVPLRYESKAQELIAWFLKMKGLEGSTYFSDPDGNVQGSHQGTLTIVSKVSSTEFVVSGFTPSQSKVLKAGDWISFANYEYKRLTDDVDSDGDGRGTLKFGPALRDNTIGSGGIISTQNAKGIFVLTNQLEYSSNHLKHHEFSIGLKERVNAS